MKSTREGMEGGKGKTLGLLSLTHLISNLSFNPRNTRFASVHEKTNFSGLGLRLK